MSTKAQMMSYARSATMLGKYGLNWRDLDMLHRWETTLSRINEITSSYEISERETARLERKEAATEQRVRDLLEAHGLTVEFGGDPRGCAIQIKLPKRDDGYNQYNSGDGESWVIDW